MSRPNRVRTRLCRRRLGIWWEQMVFGGEDLGEQLATFCNPRDLHVWCSLSRSCARVLSPILARRKSADSVVVVLPASQHLFLAMAVASLARWADKEEEKLRVDAMRERMFLVKKQKKKAHQSYVARQRLTQPKMHSHSQTNTQRLVKR